MTASRARKPTAPLRTFAVASAVIFAWFCLMAMPETAALSEPALVGLAVLVISLPILLLLPAPVPLPPLNPPAVTAPSPVLIDFMVERALRRPAPPSSFPPRRRPRIVTPQLCQHCGRNPRRSQRAPRILGPSRRVAHPSLVAPRQSQATTPPAPRRKPRIIK